MKAKKKRKSPEEIRKHQYTVWLNEVEERQFLERLKEAGSVRMPDFIRKMITQGYVQATRNKTDTAKVETLFTLLVEYKSNFRRISNYVKYTDPQLVREIEETVIKIRHVIDTI